jgi:hypothetical protein
MSAFFVGSETINAAVTLILKAEGPRSIEEVNKLGKSLWLLNALAVEQRYASEDAGKFLDEINTYSFAPVEQTSFAAILKATNCLLYQCSEGEVPELALFKKLSAITERYAEHTKTDAYDAAPWGLCG